MIIWRRIPALVRVRTERSALTLPPYSPTTFTNPNIQSFRKCTRFMQITR